MVSFRVNCTVTTMSKSKAVRGKYCIVLPGEGTFEKTGAPKEDIVQNQLT